jgi:undecaprenyl-diphosphatase
MPLLGGQWRTSRWWIMESLAAIILGLVEGFTEFLPISSTGHLILVGHWLGFDELVGQDVAATFEIVIQLGAILAVVAAYPQRFAGLLRFDDRRGFSGLRGLTLLAITSIPAGLLGLVAAKQIHARLFSPLPVAAALTAGAVWILVVEYCRPRARTAGIDALGWREALRVGLFQCLALWPGMSRSAATILGGMLSGVERKTATEYSFFAAVPIMIAATAYELFKQRQVLEHAHLTTFAIGFVVSFFAAWAAVKFLIRFLAHHTLVPFGWYRLGLAALVVWWIAR